MKLFRFRLSTGSKMLFTMTALFLVYCAAYAQGTDIDFGTATFEQVHLFVIGILTYLWGQVAKVIPSIGSIPTAATVVAGGIAIVIVAVYQGAGGILENLMAVLSTMGIYDLIIGFTRKKETTA